MASAACPIRSPARGPTRVTPSKAPSSAFATTNAAPLSVPSVRARPLAANGRALTLGTDNGAAFVVANADDGALLGVTLVGPRAGDLIGQAALAIEMGATLTDLSEILYAHPGLSEALEESAENALGKAIHILSKS